MPFVRLAFFPGGTAEQYSAVADAMAPVKPPDDRLFFAAGLVEGGWLVVQAWTSRVALEAFNREVYFPALAAVNKRGFTEQPMVVDFEPSQFIVRKPPESV